MSGERRWRKRCHWERAVRNVSGSTRAGKRLCQGSGYKHPGRWWTKSSAKLRRPAEEGKQQHTRQGQEQSNSTVISSCVFYTDFINIPTLQRSTCKALHNSLLMSTHVYWAHKGMRKLSLSFAFKARCQANSILSFSFLSGSFPRPVNHIHPLQWCLWLDGLSPIGISFSIMCSIN